MPWVLAPGLMPRGGAKGQNLGQSDTVKICFYLPQSFG